jgi:hypothetical protein
MFQQTRLLDTSPNNWNLFDIKPFKYDINKAKEPNKNCLDALGIGGFNSTPRLSGVFIHIINNKFLDSLVDFYYHK